jgi:uncharacterized damage-inducible protein DinB
MSAIYDLIARYENGVIELENALRGVPAEMLDRSPAPGKWTIRQQAAHLADSELVTGARMRWIAAEPGSPLKAYDQDKWATALHYAQQAPQQSLEMFRVLRQVTAAVLRRLPESAWTQTATHEERGPLSLQAMLELAANHAEHHIERIRELRKAFSAAA